MNIRSRIKELSEEAAGSLTVTDARIGLGYTAVRLNTGQTGVAATLHYDLPRSCSAYSGPLPISGQSARALLALHDAADYLQSAVALATTNAIFNISSSDYHTGDIMSVLDLRTGDKAAMIGRFGPLIPLIDTWRDAQGEKQETYGQAIATLIVATKKES